jgi:hypothetical protein
MRFLNSPMIGVCLLTAAGVIGCGKNLDFLRNSDTGLTQNQYELLKTINVAQVDQEDAFHIAFGDDYRPRVSDKAQRMAKLMDLSRCPGHSFVPPSTGFGASWQGHQEVSGSETCPVYLWRVWSYARDRRTWSFQENFTNLRSAEFRKLNRMSRRSATGSLSVRAIPGGETVSGRIVYSAFELDGIGSVRAEVRTEQTYRGRTAAGVVSLTVATAALGEHYASIRWGNDLNPSYFVDNVKVGDKDFLELFSSYHLLEIMANSLAMR